MSVVDGAKVNAAVTNAAYLSRTTDSNTTGKVDFENTDTVSGSSVINSQREHNGSASFSGRTVNGAKDEKPGWNSNAIGLSTDDLKIRQDNVQAQVETNTTDISTNTSDISDNASDILNKQDTSEKGLANGYASLDSGGRMPSSQLPTSATEYKGAWNASTNTPTLIDGTGTNGDLFRISVAGTQDLGSGSNTYGEGDAVIYNGTIWEKIPAETTGANTALSNLTNPTSINQTLLPSGVATRSLGSSSLPWNQAYSTRYTVNTGTSVKALWLAQAGTLAGNSYDGTNLRTNDQSNPDLTFNSAGTGHILFQSGNSAGATPSGDIKMFSGPGSGGDTGDVHFKSGDAATTDSGDVILEVGTAAGTEGDIKFVDGSEGTSGHVWTSTGTGGEGNWEVNTATATLEIAYITDEKTVNTAGGTFTSGAWRTRDLNTLVDDDSIVTSLSAQQFVLPAGTYDIEVFAPAFDVNVHKAKLRNITDSTDDLIGQSAEANAANQGASNSVIIGRIVIAAAKTFEVQHQAGATSSGTNGFGVPSNFAVVEVYTQVKITKIG